MKVKEWFRDPLDTPLIGDNIVIDRDSDPNIKGQLSEAKCLAKLIENGYAVYLPWNKDAKSDFIIERNEIFYRVQCKTARLSKDGTVLLFSTKFMHSRTKITSSYKGLVDKFVVYSYELDTVYLIDLKDVDAENSAYLRITLPKKKGYAGRIRMAKDFEI